DLRLVAIENVATELAEFNVVGRLIFGVRLEARPLVFLHRVGVPVCEWFMKWLGERVAELRQAAVGGPVIEEGSADVVPGRGEVAAVVGLCRLWWWISGMDVAPELAEQDVVGRAVLRVVFQAHALEILDGV